MEEEHLQAGFDDPENIIDVLAGDEEIPEYLRERLTTSNTDVILVACSDSGERKEIPAHLFFLEGSEVFQRMFRAHAFQEGVARRAEVKVREVKHLEQLLYFLYANKLNFDVNAPWSLEDLFELWAVIDQYVLKPSHAKNAKMFLHARMAEEMAQLGVRGVLGVVEKSMERCPVVYQILEDDKVLDGLARSSDIATSDEIFEATKQAIHLQLPQVATEKLFSSLSSSLKPGSGQLLQVLAWAAEMEGQDGPTTVDWKRMRAMCSDRVQPEAEGLGTEWAWFANRKKPSAHLTVAAALVFVKQAQACCPPCRVECMSSHGVKAMEVVSHSTSDDAWDLKCPACPRRLRVAKNFSTNHYTVTCPEHNFNMSRPQLSSWHPLSCPDCGNNKKSIGQVTKKDCCVSGSLKIAYWLLQQMPRAIAEMNAEHAVQVEELQTALAQARAELVANGVGVPDHAAGSGSGGGCQEEMEEIEVMTRQGDFSAHMLCQQTPHDLGLETRLRS